MTPVQEIELLNHVDRAVLLLQKLSRIVENMEKEIDKLYREVHK